MKKFIFLLPAALLSATAFADSYTVAFKTLENENTTSLAANADLTALLSEGADQVANVSVAAYAYQGPTGIRFGSKKASGQITLALNALGQVKADSIAVSASAYNVEEACTPTVNGQAYSISGETAARYVVKYAEPTKIESIDLAATAIGRYYVQSVTVYYTPVASTFDADRCYSPVANYPGTNHQVILAADLLTKKANADGAMKPAINDAIISWAEYANPTASVADGAAEVSVANVYTSYDAFTGDTIEDASKMTMLGCSDGNWIGYPKVEAQKTLTFYIKDTKKLAMIVTGGGSSETDNQADIVIEENGATAPQVYTTAVMPGKSQRTAFYVAGSYNNKGTSSYKFEKELDAEKSYKITLKAHNEASGTSILSAIHLYGADETVAYANYGAAKPAGSYWQYVLGPDMISDDFTKVTDGNKSHAIDQVTYPWINYTNAVNAVEMSNGSIEVQGAARFTTLDPITGDSVKAYAIQGKNGLWNDPVVDQNKNLHFYVKGTAKFKIYATGSAGTTSQLKVVATPISVMDTVKTFISADITGKSSKNDGSQSTPTCVTVDLIPGLMYHIAVSSTNSSIAVLGVNLYDVNSEANQLANKGTLNLAIAAAIAGKSAVLNLENETYTLNGEAALGQFKLAIVGNGATIVGDSTGQITLKDSLAIDNVTLNTIIAPVAMASAASLNAADTTALATWTPAQAAVLYTYEEYKALEGNAEVTEEAFAALADSSKTKTPAVAESMKYTNASNKCFEAKGIVITNAVIKSGASFFYGGNAPWAIRAITIENSILETSAKSGNAVFDLNGGSNQQIKDFAIRKSTIYADSANNQQRMLMYKGQVDPWRVWGYEGADKNAPGLNTWTLEENTIVNFTKEFARNIKATAATSLTFKKNAFVNVALIQKVGGNCTRNFTVEDNAIYGGTIDNTDASTYATIDTLMAIDYTFANGVDFHAGQSSYAAKIGAGDPRWAVEYVDPSTGIEEIAVARKSDEVVFNLAGQRVNGNAKGLMIMNGKKVLVK